MAIEGGVSVAAVRHMHYTVYFRDRSAKKTQMRKERSPSQMLGAAADDERGVLVNQTRTRLSYCPCRLISPTLRRTKFLFISSSLSSPFESGWVEELRCEPHQRC